MWKFLAVVITAILLGMVSPFLAAVDNGPILRAWFQWLPVQVDLIVLPSTEILMLGLAMVVLSVQYLLVLLVFRSLPRVSQWFLELGLPTLIRNSTHL